MEKIKITREQEEALGKYKNDSISNKLEHFTLHRGCWTNVYKTLNDFKPEQFALLLCGWYEVEQPFKVGDWVKHKDVYYKLTEKFSMSDNHLKLETALENEEGLEKVTEQWKIMLLELGRDKPELKQGDIFVTKDGVIRILQFDKYTEKSYQIFFENGSIENFYPVESRIELGGAK